MMAFALLLLATVGMTKGELCGTAHGAVSVPCDRVGTLRLRVSQPGANLRVTSVGGTTYSVHVAGRGLSLQMEMGDYTIDVQATHFVPYRRAVKIGQTPLNLLADLEPLPILGGTLVDRATRAAVSGAKVVADTGVAVVAGRNGRFTLEADPEKWPKQLTISAIGYGTRTLAVPSARASTAFDEIDLVPGSGVVAEIHQTEPGQVVDVVLTRRGSVVQTLTLKPSADVDRSARFENVEPGTYVVIARGAKAWQRAGERVEVRERDASVVHIQLSPYQLRMRALFGGAPLAGALVNVRQIDAYWDVSFESDADGSVTAEVWQTGRLGATVTARGALPFRTVKTVEQAANTEWLLEMPRFEVVGKVTDAETGAAVPKAAVALTMNSRQWRELVVSGTTDAEGAFRFAPVFPGQHTIRAAAKDYPSSEMTYTFDESEESHTVTIALQRTPMTLLTVVDGRGNAVEAADVFISRDGLAVEATRTGAGGKVPIFIPAGETRNVFVVPRDGSLAVTNLLSGAAEQTLAVPDGTSRIVVRTESESHELIPHMVLDLRYNGIVLPPDVVVALAGRGSKIESNADHGIVLNHMPPGLYEFWPVVGPGMREARLAAPPPLRLTATGGEVSAVMTFAPIEHSK